MKKFLLVFGVLVLALVGGAVYAVSSAGSLVRDGVTTYGPDQLKVSVDLEDVTLSLFDGHLSISGLALGQPEGYGDDTMVGFKSFEIDLDVMSLFGEHIIIDKVILDSPEILGRFKGGKTNFQAFSDGLDLPPAEAEEPVDAATPTMTIRRIEVRTPRLAVDAPGLADQEDVVLETIVLTDLGTDEEGLAPQQITRHVMDALTPQVTKAVLKAQGSGKLERLKNKAEKKLKKGLKSLFGKKDKN